ncbi:MAG TPA: dihydrodipicolinate synthase family protein [Casimicrobiaceae bacterium]|nr:dihydrodipicolinate synthase family protein [Casimicrobiaceae bacterium]
MRGLWCATLTPLDATGGIDARRFASHVQGLLAAGVDGVAPFGTTGEGPSFSVAERQAGLEVLLRAGVAPARIVASTGCAAITDAVALTRHALAADVVRCLVVPPFFFKDVADDAVFAGFARLIDSIADSRLRLYLYHIPQFSGVKISPVVVARLAAAYPEVIAGVKDSAGDWDNTAQLLARAPQLDILVGHEPHLPQLMRAGGAGTICGVANVYPEIVRALLSPDASAAAQGRIREFIAVLFRYPFLPAFKAIRAAQLGDGGWCAMRPPWMPLDEGLRVELVAALEAARFAVRDIRSPA